MSLQPQAHSGFRPNGVRRLEALAPALKASVAVPESASILAAIYVKW
jgi:hypothetical protein